MSTQGSIQIWLARWAAGADQVDFAPGRIGSILLSLLPDRYLPSPLLALFSWLFLRHLNAREITDGNVNYSFCVAGRRGQKLFVKQAHAFLKWQPQMALETERMAREVRYFRDAADALGEERAAQYLPRIVHFDPEDSVMLMEYLDGFHVLFDVCFDVGKIPRAAAVGLGTFVGRVHAKSLSQPVEAAALQGVSYWNPTLRAIQQEHVFTSCFENCARGRFFAMAFPDVMAQVAILKAKYLGYSFDSLDRYALCHGDLHPGGVMVAADGRVKVIDPEFCSYAPPVLDIGSLMSGIVLAHLYRRQSFAAAADRSGAAQASAAEALELHEALEVLWSSYVRVLSGEGVGAEQIGRIGADAVGFCMLEVCRTALGFAGARDPAHRIKSSAALERYQEVAVGYVRHCLKHRGKPEAEGGGIACLLDWTGDLERLSRQLSAKDKVNPRA